MTNSLGLDALILHRAAHPECISDGWAKDLDFELLTPSQAVVLAAEADSHSARWMLPEGWFLDEAAQRERVEALLSATHQAFGRFAFPELDVWRRVNRTYMRILAGSCAAAFEASAWMRANGYSPPRVGLLIDPAHVTTLQPLGADDTFALVLKSLLPELVLVDSRTGERLVDQRHLTVTLGLEFAVPAGSQLVERVDVLVCEAAIRDPWEAIVRPGASALTLRTAGYSRRLGEKALGPDIRPKETKVAFPSHPVAVKRDDCWQVLRPVLKHVWMVQLESMREQANELLNATEPETLVVCDHTFPESALLVSQRSPTTKVVTMPHGPGGVDIDLWRGVDGLTAHVPTNSARHQYELQGSAAVVDENCFPGLRNVYSPRELRVGKNARIRAVVVGSFPFWEQYPRTHRKQFESTLSAVMSRPTDLRSTVRLSVKPRPGTGTQSWYERIGEHDELIPESTPLVEVFTQSELAILVVEHSTAAFEAIANGCAVVVVSRDSDLDARSDQAANRGSLIDAETLPVLHPDDFWQWMRMQNSESLQAIWSAQARWLRSQLLAEVIVDSFETVHPAS